MTGWLTGVLGNLAGDSITGTALYLTRHWWMPLWVAFHHKHKTAHLERLASKENNG